MKQNRQWYYRGNLKSCNYSCSYCPFSKKKSSLAKIEEDRQNFFRFIEQLEKQEDMGGAVQVVPYGEALVHCYYWEGLAKLSQNPRIEAVGAQSNFSFPVEKMLTFYVQKGGQISKLRLWGTFHPEMTSVEAFVAQCEILSRWQVSYSVGAVGVPEQLPHIRRLRKELDSSVYLWINKMDGMGRNYTETEIEDFLEVDEYFELELKHYRADMQLCRDNIFVEADGTMRRCNLCRQSTGNFYEELSEMRNLVCTRKECSCYLAYSNRNEKELLFFKPYPAFRIPVYPKAVFFDVDGTLVPEGQKQISKEYSRRIAALSKHCAVYLVTSLPMEDAFRKTKGIWKVVAGGVFANGGRCVILGNSQNLYQNGEGYDTIFPVETAWLEYAWQIKKKYGFRIHTYQKENQIYKVTLSFPGNRFQSMESAMEFAEQVAVEVRIPKTCNWILDGNCIQVTKAGRGKLEGILEILDVLGYRTDEIMVAGNSDCDAPILEYFPFSVAAENSSEKAKEAARVRF